MRLSAVALGVLALAVGFGSIVVLAEVLRHPPDPDAPVLPEDPTDPRVQIECPEPEPREDVERDTPAVEPTTAPPVEVTSAELLACPEFFHEQQVRYRGEVVAGVLPRRAGAWAQLNDDLYAEEAGPLPAHRGYVGMNSGIGVLFPREVAAEIRTAGGPGVRGDIVEVEGVFRRVDHSTSEVTVIRADEATIVEPGEPVETPAVRGRGVAAAVLATLAVLLVVAERVYARARP